jgi:hypothetical protein
VKGARRHTSGTEVAQSRAHFSSGTLGKGQGENAIGSVGARRNSIGNAMREGPSFSGARAGQNAHGPAKGDGDASLFVVKSRQNLFRV